MNAELAEFVGAMIGDGCLSLAKRSARNGTRKIALLTGNLKNDTAYYKEIIRPIIQTNFNVDGYMRERKERNCIYLVMSSGIFDFLKELSFPVGKKIQLEIPEIIRNDKDFAKACVRGIFNTDGSIYRRYSKMYAGHRRLYDFLVIQFKMNSREVIEQIKLILEKLDIATNNVILETKASVLRITRQEDVRKFMEEIQPSSRYHVERYINRCKEGSNIRAVSSAGGAPVSKR